MPATPKPAFPTLPIAQKLKSAFSSVSPIKRNDAGTATAFAAAVISAVRNGDTVCPALLRREYLSLRPEGTLGPMVDGAMAAAAGIRFRDVGAVLAELVDRTDGVGAEAEAGTKAPGELIEAWHFVLHVLVGVVQRAEEEFGIVVVPFRLD